MRIITITLLLSVCFTISYAGCAVYPGYIWPKSNSPINVIHGLYGHDTTTFTRGDTIWVAHVLAKDGEGPRIRECSFNGSRINMQLYVTRCPVFTDFTYWYPVTEPGILRAGYGCLEIDYEHTMLFMYAEPEIADTTIAAADTTAAAISSITYAANNINVRPNPFVQNVTVNMQTAYSQPCVFTVYNQMGQNVFSKQVLQPAETNTLDLSELQVGTYILSVEINGERISRNIVKQ